MYQTDNHNNIVMFKGDSHKPIVYQTDNHDTIVMFKGDNHLHIVCRADNHQHMAVSLCKLVVLNAVYMII